MKKVFLKFLFVILLLLMCGIGIHRWSIYQVAKSAERISANNPYCIQIPSETNYKEIRTNLEISIFKMPTQLVGLKTRSRHYAVLIVERDRKYEMFHWSYRNQSFIKGVIGPPAVFCKPNRAYTVTFGKNDDKVASAIEFRINGSKFSVPRAISPTVKNNSKGITFYATAPFLSIQERAREHPRSLAKKDIMEHVEVIFGRDERIELWRRKNGVMYNVRAEAVEAGLNKEIVWKLPVKENSQIDKFSLQYVQLTHTGNVTTLISCSNANQGYCLHIFYDGIWTYIFHHRKMLLDDWRAMQENLSILARSFVVSQHVITFTEGFHQDHLVFEIPLNGD